MASNAALQSLIANEPPLEAAAALRKAVAHYKQGEFAAAALAAASAAEAHASYAAAYHLLGLALDNLGQRSKAFEMYERALGLDPANANLTLDLANAAARLHLHEGAASAYRAYLVLRPDCPKGVSGLALCLLAAGNVDEGKHLTESALDRAPESAELWNALGAIKTEACDFEGAIAAYAPAQRLAPTTARAYHNIAHAQSHIGAYTDAIANFTHALELASDEGERAAIRHARGLCHAAAGNLRDAWSDYEERHNEAFAQATHFAIPAPRWEGEDLAGLKLLVVGEQGLGDEIMFASMIPDLLDRIGPTGKLMLAVDQRLAPLFQRSFPTAIVGAEMHTRHAKPVRLVPWATGDNAPDFFTPIGSLLNVLRPTPENFTKRAYLKADLKRVRYWQSRLEALGPGPYVGISWKSMLATTPRKKFFSTLAHWRPLLESTAVKFVNLQYGDCKAELDAARRDFGITIHDFAEIDLTNDIDDKAALCEALDLVISSPTAPAMLAAAVGTPTWLLTAGPLWQQLGTETYPWYANTRVLTPEKFADWAALMPRVACELENFASR